MPNGFTRSKKGEEMYTLIGRDYENTIDDNDYIAFINKTRNSPHSSRNKKQVMVMVRLRADDGKEYLKYDLRETRYDAIGAEWSEYLPNLGVYPIPVANPTIQYGENMTTSEVRTGPIIRYDIGYEIPFIPEEVDKIHEMANDISYTQRTQYILKAGSKKVTVKKYQDFRDRDFDDLETGAYLLLEENEQEQLRPQRKSSKAKTIATIPTE